MSSINRVILIGRLGADPEIKQTDTGRTRATFRIATSEAWTDKTTGERNEHTEWHHIVVWGKTADLVGEHLHKGRQVCIEGKVQTRKWTDTDGKDRYSTEIVGSQVTFLGSKEQAA